MPFIVLLNGPPGSGKDQAAKFLEEIDVLKITHKKFGAKPKRDCAAIFNFPRTWNQMEMSAPDWKNQPSPLTFGLTPRDACWRYVKFMCDNFGDDFFAKFLADEIVGSPAKMIVVSDSGYRNEAAQIVKRFGKDSVLLAHLMRDGCTFENDDRQYVELDGVTTVDINNKHDLFFYRVQIVSAVFKWAGWELPEDING